MAEYTDGTRFECCGCGEHNSLTLNGGFHADLWYCRECRNTERASPRTFAFGEYFTYYTDYHPKPGIKPQEKRILRPGWDNITIQGAPAYLRGDWQAYYSCGAWRLRSPEILITNSFTTADQAMEFVEKHFG